MLLDYVEDRLSGQGPSLLPEGATQRALARIVVGRYGLTGIGGYWDRRGVGESG